MVNMRNCIANWFTNTNELIMHTQTLYKATFHVPSNEANSNSNQQYYCQCMISKHKCCKRECFDIWHAAHLGIFITAQSQPFLAATCKGAHWLRKTKAPESDSILGIKLTITNYQYLHKAPTVEYFLWWFIKSSAHLLTPCSVAHPDGIGRASFTCSEKKFAENFTA